MLKLAAMYPQTTFIFGYPQVEGSFVGLTLQDTETGAFNIFNTDIWTHQCMAYNKDTNHLIVVKVFSTLLTLVKGMMRQIGGGLGGYPPPFLQHPFSPYK